MAKVINFLAFQAVWFVCVFSASEQLPWVGAGAALLFVVATLMVSATPRADAILVTVAVLVGGLLDTLWGVLDMMRFAASPWGVIAPPWILGLWAAFAMTLNHSLAWLRFRYVWMGALAAVACPLSYYAGQRLGAVEWLKPWWVILIVPASWAFFMAFLCVLNRKVLMQRRQYVTSMD